MRDLAAEGRTVFLSSHLTSEMSQTSDQPLAIGRGHIIAAGSVQQVIDSVASGAVRVRSPRVGGPVGGRAEHVAVLLEGLRATPQQP